MFSPLRNIPSNDITPWDSGGQRNLVGYSPWVTKSRTRLSDWRTATTVSTGAWGAPSSQIPNCRDPWDWPKKGHVFKSPNKCFQTFSEHRSLLEHVLQTQSPEPHMDSEILQWAVSLFYNETGRYFCGSWQLAKMHIPRPPTPLSQFPEKGGSWREGMGHQNLHFSNFLQGFWSCCCCC